MKKSFSLLCALLVAGCATVQEADTSAWKGQPVAALDAHPIFLTMPVEVRRLPDGTEVRNYVNGKDIAQCFGGASANSYGQSVVYASGRSFCSTSFAACNNMFYIKDGVVQRYTPVGSGGAQCFTNSTIRPTGWQGQQLKR